MAENQLKSALIKNLRVLIKPVIKLCIKRSLNLQDLLESAKVVFLQVAEEELKAQGKKINLSRLSAMTGVHRKDAFRIYRAGEEKEETGGITSRVIGLWREHPKFLSGNNRPRVLSYKGDDSELAELVRMISSDIKSGAVVFALEQVGAVEKTPAGLRLNAAAYVPKGNPTEAIRLMSSDVEDLMEAVMANAESSLDELPNYHAKSIYDNVAKEDLPNIRTWIFNQASNFQTKVEKYLAKHDLDLNPDPEKTPGGRVILGVFTRT